MTEQHLQATSASTSTAGDGATLGQVVDGAPRAGADRIAFDQAQPAAESGQDGGRAEFEAVQTDVASGEVSGDATLATSADVTTPGGLAISTDSTGTEVATPTGDTVTVAPDGTVRISHVSDVLRPPQPQPGATAAGAAPTGAVPDAADDAATVLRGDGTYLLPDQTRISIADGVVTITRPDGESVVVEDGQPVKVDLPEDAADDLQDKLDQAQQEAQERAEEARRKAEEEAEKAKEEAAAAGGGGSPSGGGGGGPTGGGGGGPTGGGGGGGPTGGQDPGASDAGQDGTPGTGSTDEVSVDPEQLRREAGNWSGASDTMTSVATTAEGLTLDAVDFGLAAPLQGAYATLQTSYVGLANQGASAMDAISTTLQSNADSYDETERTNTDQAETVQV